MMDLLFCVCILRDFNDRLPYLWLNLCFFIFLEAFENLYMPIYVPILILYLFARIPAPSTHTYTHAQEVIRRAPQLALRWLKGVCPPQIFLDRALGKQVGEVER